MKLKCLKLIFPKPKKAFFWARGRCKIKMFFSGSVKIEQPGTQPTPVSSELVPGAQNELIGRLQYPTFLPSDFTVSTTR